MTEFFVLLSRNLSPVQAQAENLFDLYSVSQTFAVNRTTRGGTILHTYAKIRTVLAPWVPGEARPFMY